MEIDCVVALGDSSYLHAASRNCIDWIGHPRGARGKATMKNKQPGKLDSKIEDLHIPDWKSFSEGKEKSGWFRGDLNLISGIRLTNIGRGGRDGVACRSHERCHYDFASPNFASALRRSRIARHATVRRR